MHHHMLMCAADVRDLWAIWSSAADTTVSLLACVADCSGSMILICRRQHVKQECMPLCRGSNKETRGTAYVVYEDIYDAKTAVEHLSGFNVANRYLIVLYYNHNKHSKKVCPVCSNFLPEALRHEHNFPFSTRLSSVPLLRSTKPLLVCKQGSHKLSVCGHVVAQRVLCCV